MIHLHRSDQRFASVTHRQKYIGAAVSTAGPANGSAPRNPSATGSIVIVGATDPAG